MGKLRKALHEVLKNPSVVHSTTLHRYYRKWRELNGIAIERCDIEGCFFNHPKNEMLWNKEPLKPILDHISGNSKDNEPTNLRFVCPNCDSQLPTRGGGNKGRTRYIGKEGSYLEIDKKNGTQAAHTASVRFVVKTNFKAGKVSIENDI